MLIGMHLGSHPAHFCARLLGIRELLAVIGLESYESERRLIGSSPPRGL
jgi:hypothetical protein